MVFYLKQEAYFASISFELQQNGNRTDNMIIWDSIWVDFLVANTTRRKLTRLKYRWTRKWTRKWKGEGVDETTHRHKIKTLVITLDCGMMWIVPTKMNLFVKKSEIY